MDFMNQLGGLLGQMGADPEKKGDSPAAGFEQLAALLPQDVLTRGITAAFQSDQTPPFAQMVAQLFSGAGASQKAGLLNTLLAAVGPTLLQQMFSSQSPGAASSRGSAGMGGAIGGVLGSLLGGGRSQLTPEEADRIPGAEVINLAQRAQETNPSVLENVSRLFANDPNTLQSLGSTALGLIMSKVTASGSGA
jgi:hypothetical protein